MGWSYGPKPRNVTEWLREICTGEGERYSHRPVETAVMGFTEAYAAVEFTDKETGHSEVGAVTFMIRYTRDSYEQFGYKSVGEEAGPVIARAPQKILDKLTPTDNEHAQNWRRACQERLDRHAANKVAKDEFVRFPEPLRDSSGTTHTLFRMMSPTSSLFMSLDEDLGYEKGVFTMKGWRDREFTRLSQTQTVALKDAWEHNKREQDRVIDELLADRAPAGPGR